MPDERRASVAIIGSRKPTAYGRKVTYQLSYDLAKRGIVVISGLADAIIVTEAAIRSGTLSTVTHALEQGREVFVVPANITSPLSAGCNALIKQGAHPITCAEDVIEVIAPDLLQPQQILALGNTPLESIIINLLQAGIRDGDQLQLQSEADVSEFSQTLTMLEITGTVRALGGNQWTLR